MPQLPIYQVDAFTRKRFHGNPAAVVPLETWLPDETMQAIAQENNLAETAFFVRRSDGNYDLRWFTPELEIPLCGHATLASGYVLFEYLDFLGEVIHFHSKSGELTVQKIGDKFALNFPARPLQILGEGEHEKVLRQLTSILGKAPSELFHSVNNYFAVYDQETDVGSMKPDFTALNSVEGVIGVIVTARGIDYDCVSRYFCPNCSIPEDPVTGSAHCSIIPYWAEQLGKTSLHAYQASARGGELFCEFRLEVGGNRVIISGYVAPYLKGLIEC